MNGWVADLLSGIGLTLAFVGSWTAARAVILSEDDAINIGLARYGSEDREAQLALPMVRNLLASSRGAKWGLLMIAAGSLMQLSPIVYRLISMIL